MGLHVFNVDPSNPHNDQLAAHVADDLEEQLQQVHQILDQAEEINYPLASVLAVIATAYIDDEDSVSRSRMASLLALALVRLAAHERIES